MYERPSVPSTPEQLRALALGGEKRGVEFKERVTGAPAIRKVVRAVAAMANLREGGLVVLGVEDKTGNVPGLNERELEHWSDSDKARSTINAWLEPSANFDCYVVGECVVLDVQPFSRTPLIARVSKGEASESDALVEGRLFYRSSVTTGSSPISRLEDWVELRETLLLRAATGAKRLEEERRRAEAAADEERIKELLRAAEPQFVRNAIDDAADGRGVLGKLAGNMRLFQIRSMQVEAKSNLKSAFTALMSYHNETDRFPPSLAAAGFAPYPRGCYVFRAAKGEIIGANQLANRPELVAAGVRALSRYDAEPHIGTKTFLVMAVARIEPEGLLDVWLVDRFGDPRCITPETTNLSARRWKSSIDALSRAAGESVE